MSAIESSLRLEIAQYQASLAKAKGDAAKFREQLQQEGRQGGAALNPIVEGWTRVNAQQKAARAAFAGKGGFSNLGMVSMQFQDIAVQAQMGTKASIIMAQQGSQMLSAFGPAGMIAGAVAAIGGALFVMGEKSKEAFAAAQAGARDFDLAMTDAAHGSASDLVAAIGKVSDRSKDLRAEMQQIATGGLMPAFEQMLGGANVQDKINLNADQQRKALEYRRTLGAELAAASADETRLAQLRASGHTDEAAALENEINLKSKLYSINRMDVDGHVKQQLAADAVTQSGLAGGSSNPTKDKAELARLQQKLKDEALATLDPTEKFIALSKEQEAVFASMAEKGGLFYEQSLAGLQAWSDALGKAGKTQEQLAVVKMLDQAGTLEAQKKTAAADVARARDEKQRIMDQKRDEIQAVKDKMAAEQERFAARYKAEQDLKAAQEEAKRKLAEDVQIETARKAGDMDKVKQLEHQRDVRRKTQEIVASTGMNESAGITAAEMLESDSSVPAKARRKARYMGGGDAGPLAGRGSSQIPRHMMGGLNDYYDLQAGTRGALGRYLGPSANGMTMMGGPMQGMAEDNASKAAAQDRTVSFGTREFETLVGIKAGIDKLLA